VHRTTGVRYIDCLSSEIHCPHMLPNVLLMWNLFCWCRPGFFNRGSAEPCGSARDRDWKKKTSFFELVSQNKQIHRKILSTQRALTVIIGLLYLQLTDHVNVPWAVDIIFLCRGSLRPEIYFKGSSRVKRLRKADVGKCLSSESIHWSSRFIRKVDAESRLQLI
jgi:hypothetical protein